MKSIAERYVEEFHAKDFRTGFLRRLISAANFVKVEGSFFLEFADSSLASIGNRGQTLKLVREMTPWQESGYSTLPEGFADQIREEYLNEPCFEYNERSYSLECAAFLASCGRGYFL